MYQLHRVSFRGGRGWGVGHSCPLGSEVVNRNSKITSYVTLQKLFKFEDLLHEHYRSTCTCTYVVYNAHIPTHN